MRPAQLALARAEQHLIERLGQLEAKVNAGDERAWLEYGQLAAALAAVMPSTAPGANGEMLTTAEMAKRLQLSTRTVLRKVKAGELKPERFGKRGPGALRWSA
ncbi:MAG: helix-turn-helix domain-containing protein [Candidatus Rokubacteria bacterium]|nr:helix-turn-helix domain-containing protein [Candidatus Rokubacteria bacterium]